MSDWGSLLCSGLPLQAGPGCSEAFAMRSARFPLPFDMSDRTVYTEVQDTHRSCSWWAGLMALGLCVAPEVGPRCHTPVLRAVVFRAGLCSHTTVTPDRSWHEVEEFRLGLREKDHNSHGLRELERERGALSPYGAAKAGPSPQSGRNLRLAFPNTPQRAGDVHPQRAMYGDIQAMAPKTEDWAGTKETPAMMVEFFL